jgi:predicted lipoprotein with Yx(FWY)xxD motif
MPLVVLAAVVAAGGGAGPATLAVASGGPDPARAREATGSPSPARLVESYVAVPMPPGFRVEMSDLDGAVFADSRGKTLYMWPFKGLRSGVTGESKGSIACTDAVRTETAGLMSPYPRGLVLPDLDHRASCAKRWPPVLAADDAKPIGKWTLLVRKDGKKQWAYDEQALYTSDLDREPGDVLGGSTRKNLEDAPAIRVPVGPPPDVPPGFDVASTAAGRLLVTAKNTSVYASDNDPPDKSSCGAECARTWAPVLAPQTAQPHGDWSTLQRSPGVKQWVFRHKPLYAYELDEGPFQLQGSDVPGWHNVYTQPMPAPPAGFTVQDTIVGQVLADPRGRTIYTYVCDDDSMDQLGCDHPSETQIYRLAMCGGGLIERCLANWPYVTAARDAKSSGRVWSVIDIDPKTGRRAASGQSGTVRVWAFRDRPVYTYAADQRPGDVSGDGTGEWRGQRNGLKAFFLRDDFFEATL